jgi:hypothetical protein
LKPHNISSVECFSFFGLSDIFFQIYYPITLLSMCTVDKARSPTRRFEITLKTNMLGFGERDNKERPYELEVQLRSAAGTTETETEVGSPASDAIARLKIAFTPTLPCQKGIVHASEAHGQNTIDAETRESLLKAITRARSWMDAILSGEIASFDDIAVTKNLAPRYIRRLTLLAFLSPKIIRAIDDGTAPPGLTVTRLTQALPHAWSEQEAMFGFC